MICFILANTQDHVSWQKLGNVEKYDAINDYINRLFYFVFEEDDNLYQNIYYYDDDIIIKQKLNIEINNPDFFKLSYNNLIYQNESFYHAALLTVLKNNSLSLYINDNFGYHKNSSNYRWDLIKNIEVNDAIYDIAYGINNSWIICYNKDIECQITYDGLEWFSVSFPYSGCDDIKIVSSHKNNWGVYCYDTDFLIYRSAIYIDNIFENGFEVSANGANMKISTLPDGKTLFLIDNTIYYSSDIKNEFMFAKDYTSMLINYPKGFTDMTASARLNKFHLILENQLLTTANGANNDVPTILPIQDVANKKIITSNIDDHFGSTYLISHVNNELYIAKILISTLGSQWRYLLRKDNVEIEYDFEKEIVLSGDIKFVSNITMLITKNVTVNGDLTLNTNLILNKTSINVNGTLHLGGNLTVHLPDNDKNFTLFTFTNLTGEFDQIEFDNHLCGEYLEYEPNRIIVLFDPTQKCNPDGIKSDFILSNDFLYIIIASCVVFVIVIIVLSFFVFRKKIFPHRYIPSEFQE